MTRWASLGQPNVHRRRHRLLRRRAPVPARRSRAVAAAIVLILLLVFILENTQSVKISYFGASGHMPLGVALLLAAAGGALLIAVVGTLRITQLRRHSKRQRRQ